MIKRTVKKLIYVAVNTYKLRLLTKIHKRELKNYQSVNGIKIEPTEGEAEYITKWKPLYKKVNVDFYRFYSRYIGTSPDIVSDDIFHIIIEPILNNQTGLAVYSDKNMFEKLFNPAWFPVCVLRKMEGDYMDRDYHILKMNDVLFEKMVLNNKILIKQARLIVKPSVETGGGVGVRLFNYKDGSWVSNDGLQLSLNFLDKYYKSNFIMQECIEPSEFVKQFNPTSYSTLRIFTFRSITDDRPHFIGGYLRVGAKGSFKDNIWGGGYACPINTDGTLGKYASDAKRQRFENINGISLTDKIFKIPNFDKVLELVFNVSITNTLNRLLSFDIMLDSDDQPRMIEYNIKNQTVTTVQTLQHPFFGEFTDEVIDYCQNHMDKICYPFIIKA